MTNTKLAIPQSHSIVLGCDPEFFFKKGRKVIASEKILPKTGLIVYQDNARDTKPNKIIIDGVQAEINPKAYTCREVLSWDIARSISTMQEYLDKNHKGITMDFSRTIKMTKKSLMELDLNNQRFGCAPSFSAYKTEHKKIAKVDPLKYLSRSAGGHIHIGVTNVDYVHKNAEKFVHMLDIICGNTMVLVDRDPSNIKRRELYGRAGEYRLPSHGLEYRTLSNCWIISYPLMSLAFGMARLAIDLMLDSKNEEYYDSFMKAIDIQEIEKAINNNDYDLALSNFKKIIPLLEQVVYSDYSDYSRVPLNKINIPDFLFFVDKINTKGLEYWFKADVVKHWKSRNDGNWYGFRDFLTTKVNPKRLQKEQKEKVNDE